MFSFGGRSLQLENNFLNIEKFKGFYSVKLSERELRFMHEYLKKYRFVYELKF